jgi:hypothetical protein
MYVLGMSLHFILFFEKNRHYMEDEWYFELQE